MLDGLVFVLLFSYTVLMTSKSPDGERRICSDISRHFDMIPYDRALQRK